MTETRKMPDPIPPAKPPLSSCKFCSGTGIAWVGGPDGETIPINCPHKQICAEPDEEEYGE